MTNLELQNALAPLGFTYAPDPASQKVSTLGGNVGENSGGPHCLKYGVTSNHVLGMTVVLSDGQVVQLGGPALDPPGYDLRGVLIGSEGTLGIVTELVVRILPAPESVVTLLAVYDTHAEAAESVSAVIAAGIVPATLEMMDSTVIRAVEDSKPCGYPRDAAAVLIIEVDGPAVGLQQQAEQDPRDLHGRRMPRGPPGQGRRRAGSALGGSPRGVRGDCPAGAQLSRGRLHGAPHAVARRPGPRGRDRRAIPAPPRQRLPRRRRQPPSAVAVRLARSRSSSRGSIRRAGRSCRRASSWVARSPASTAWAWRRSTPCG